MHIRQSEVAASIAIGQFLVIETEQVQYGGVQIVDVNLVLDGREAELIGRAVNVSALDAATSKPH